MRSAPCALRSLMLSTPIIVEETAGIDRTNEPVTVGIPFPKGFLKDKTDLHLVDPGDGPLPLQTQTLATWPDNSPKWVLLDFQVSVRANTMKKLKLTRNKLEATANKRCHISTEESQAHLRVDTGTASFFVNTRIFKPFDRVLIDGKEIVDSTKSNTALTIDSDTKYEPLIDKIFFETKGPLRTTLKVEGKFRYLNKPSLASFFSRISFFANSSLVKVEFTILNPRAAKHPGGLWDLGDPGSIFFKDLSIHTALKSDLELPSMPAPCSVTSTSLGSYELVEDPVPMDYQNKLTAHSSQLTAKDPGSFTPLNDERRATSNEQQATSNLLIYQDSSGGENWKSRNHVNRNNEVTNSFRGYRIYEDGQLRSEGLRANPVISITDEQKQISGTVQYFWQNFPKALEVKSNTLTIRLFPDQCNDIFELQGGEQKTHTIFLNFALHNKENSRLEWIQTPLIPRTTPEWYSNSKAITYLIPQSFDNIVPMSQIPSPLTGEGKGEGENKGGGDKNLTPSIMELINTAIKGKNTFFLRREIIDEYGWRHFGEFYADHEAVRHKGSEPLISHYNNQYDCVYGALIQFVRSGEQKWFILADQLSSHVKDIDIYHTDEDRPEYNRGMFWHTDHYIEVRTATHRCFSKLHADQRDMAVYGGGPSLSHNYSSGLLYHYYITGNASSMEAVKELASFIENNMDMETTLSNQLIRGIRKTQAFLKNIKDNQELVQQNKVYGLDGPGRASGNSLNVLLNAYVLTNSKEYLERADDLIYRCINPDDNIERRDLLDAENRWMYTVFLQSLGKYIDVKTEKEQFDQMWQYARQSLVHYAEWMLNNEYLYLEQPEKLEYPNETWPAQELRKCNVLLYTARYSKPDQNEDFLKKADLFYNKSINQLNTFSTKGFTRPIAIIMQNAMMHNFFRINNIESLMLHKVHQNTEDFTGGNYDRKVLFSRSQRIMKTLRSFSLKKEAQFIKWRIGISS